MSRLNISSDEKFTQNWKEMIGSGAIDKAAFYMKAQHHFGSDLATLMKLTLEETLSTTHEVELQGMGSWMHEEDIKEKYAKQPKHLAAILANTRRLTCPISKAEILEDMEYKFTFTESNKRSRQSVSNATVHNRAKRIKQAKALTEPQKTWLTKQVTENKPLTKLIELMKTLDDEESKTWMQFFPELVLKQARAVVAKVEATQQFLGMMNSTGECVDFKLDQTQWKGLIEEVKELFGRMQVLVDQALKAEAAEGK